MAHRSFAGALALTLALLGLALAPARSRAAAYLPPAGRLYAGITAGDPATYEQQTHAHAAIFQEFITWGGGEIIGIQMHQHIPIGYFKFKGIDG